jgi:circadian clock protein KaiC
MSQPENSGDKEIERFPTFVSGLDVILSGGFLRGGLYMVQGPPGVGKTTLANQIVFNRAREGSRTLYVTMMGENHGRMMAHLHPMRFFDAAFIPDNVSYLSAYQVLEDEGIEGLSTLLRREVLARRTTLLVLDSMAAIEANAEAKSALKRFAYGLQVLASSTNCTMFLLTTASGATPAPEATMVDGLIELRQREYGLRMERRAVVHKLRGSRYLEGEHPFNITQEGVTFFPRVEAAFARPTSRAAPSGTRLSFGVPSLDAMFGGGLPVGAVAAAVGVAGAGKTTLGLHFLSGSSAEQPGLLFGCYESPERLRFRTAAIGIDLVGAEQRGDVEVLWCPTGEYILDELAHRLLDAVGRRKVKRLVIDGLSVFQEAALEPERIIRFWSVLSNELRARGVTTLHTVEQQELSGPEVRMPLRGIASLSDVMILLRFVELRSQLHRLISLLKVREGTFDPTLRRFSMGGAGIVVEEPFKGVEGILSGTAREVMAAAAVLSGISGEAISADDPGQPA